MEELTIDSDNFSCLSNISEFLQGIKRLYINELPKNYELILNSYNELEYIFLDSLKTSRKKSRNQNIILQDLMNLKEIELYNCKMKLTLKSGLDSLNTIDVQFYSRKLKIVDENNYLERLTTYKKYIKGIRDMKIKLNEKFINVTELHCFECDVNIGLDCYPKLKFANFNNCIIFGEADFSSLKYLYIQNKANNKTKFIFSDKNFWLNVFSPKFPSLEKLYLYDFSIIKLKSNCQFYNLKNLVVSGNNLKYLIFNEFKESNKILENCKIDTKN